MPHNIQRRAPRVVAGDISDYSALVQAALEMVGFLFIFTLKDAAGETPNLAIANPVLQCDSDWITKNCEYFTNIFMKEIPVTQNTFSKIYDDFSGTAPAAALPYSLGWGMRPLNYDWVLFDILNAAGINKVTCVERDCTPALPIWMSLGDVRSPTAYGRAMAVPTISVYLGKNTPKMTGFYRRKEAHWSKIFPGHICARTPSKKFEAACDISRSLGFEKAHIVQIGADNSHFGTLTRRMTHSYRVNTVGAAGVPQRSECVTLLDDLEADTEESLELFKIASSIVGMEKLSDTFTFPAPADMFPDVVEKSPPGARYDISGLDRNRRIAWEPEHPAHVSCVKALEAVHRGRSLWTARLLDD